MRNILPVSYLHQDLEVRVYKNFLPIELAAELLSSLVITSEFKDNKFTNNVMPVCVKIHMCYL